MSKQKFFVKRGEAWHVVNPDDLEPGDIFRVEQPDGAVMTSPEGITEWTFDKVADDGRIECDPYIPEPEAWTPQAVNIGTETSFVLRWMCRNPACKKPVTNRNQALAKDLMQGGTATVQVSCCGKTYLITKKLIVEQSGRRPALKVVP